MEGRLPRNVIRDLRESLGLTQKDLAERAGVTPQRVLREEQFVYVTPSDSIIKALSDALPLTTDVEIIDKYTYSRNQLHREFTEDLCTSPFYNARVKEAVDFAIDYWDALSELRSPTKMFRQALFEHYGLPTSAIKFSIFTGMHPGTLSDIETGKTDWEGASALVHVLRSSLAVPHRYIEQLGRLHDQYFMRKVHH